MKAQQRAAEKGIRDYAESLIIDYTKAEYEMQINKWRRAINLVADAHKRAFESHESVLKEIDRQRQARWEFAMLALSLVAGPALSWLSAAIQFKGVPKWLGKNRVIAENAVIQRVNTQTMHINKVNLNHLWGRKESIKLITSSRDYSKVQAKIFGDLAGSLAGEALNASLSNTKPQASGDIDTQLEKLIRDDGDPNESFKTRLENVLLTQSNFVVKSIMNLGMTIKHKVDFGAQWLKIASSEGSKTSLDRQERVAKSMIRDHINKIREKWANEWFYYGHDPNVPSVDQMSRIIEREIWALWFLEQDIHWVPSKITYVNSQYRYVAEAHMSDKIHSPLYHQLAFLDIVQGNVGHIMQRAERHIKEPASEILVPKVTGNVDTAIEISAINRWAKNHKPESLSGDIGPLRATRRKLPSIESMFKQ